MGGKNDLTSRARRYTHLLEPEVVLALEVVGAINVHLVVAVLHVRSVQDLVVAAPIGRSNDRPNERTAR